MTLAFYTLVRVDMILNDENGSVLLIKSGREPSPFKIPSTEQKTGTARRLGTFWRPPTFRSHLHQNSGEYGGPSPELCVNVREILVNMALWVSPKFARLRFGYALEPA